MDRKRSNDPKRKREKRKEKGKLTLSVAPEYVAMLRKVSARRGRSISDLVEDLALDLDSMPESTKMLWADQVNGMGENAFSDKDYKRTDLLGALLRKHLPRKKSTG